MTKFEDFFDPYAIKHIEAYDHLEKTGMWPDNFLPADLDKSLAYLNVILVQSMMARAWKDYMLSK